MAFHVPNAASHAAFVSSSSPIDVRKHNIPHVMKIYGILEVGIAMT